MKIAICLVGLVGDSKEKYGSFGKGHTPVDYRIGHYFTMKNIVETNQILGFEVDFFIHSWSVNFEKELIDSYQPKKYIIEKQINFNQDTNRKNAIKSRWYSTYQSMSLKKSYEVENNFIYDYVMLHRFDRMFKVPLIFNQFNKDLFHISHTESCTNQICSCKSTGRFHDTWFFSNSEYMDKFSTLYLTLDNKEIETPHEQCVKYIKEIGLYDKVNHTFTNKKDHETIRDEYSNCQYIPGSKFDISKLIKKR